MTEKQAKKIAKLTGLMILVRDELEDLQATKQLPKRLNSRTNSWLTDANDLLSTFLDGGDEDVHEQIDQVHAILHEKFGELVIE